MPARRVAPLYGSFTEILAAMGLEKRIIARTVNEDDADGNATVAIGTHLRPNVELLVGLKPDLVLQFGGRKDALLPVEQLRAQGIPVAVFTASGFDDLFSLIERLGILTGEPDRAKDLADAMRSRLAAVDAALAADPARPRVFYEVRYPNLLGAGRGSFVSDVITRAGGTNCVLTDDKFIRLGEEELYRLDPDAYVVQRGPMNPAPEAPAARDHFAGLRAVAAGKVLTVDERLFSRPGPRSVEAVESLARFLHPTVSIPAPEARP